MPTVPRCSLVGQQRNSGIPLKSNPPFFRREGTFLLETHRCLVYSRRPSSHGRAQTSNANRGPHLFGDVDSLCTVAILLSLSCKPLFQGCHLIPATCVRHGVERRVATRLERCCLRSSHQTGRKRHDDRCRCGKGFRPELRAPNALDGTWICRLFITVSTRRDVETRGTPTEAGG